jgi:hypothetical protein
MRIFAYPSLILSQSLSQSVARSRSSSHHCMNGEWITDKGMQWLHRAQLILNTHLHLLSIINSSASQRYVQDSFSFTVRDTGNLIPHLSRSYLVSITNPSKIKWDRGREFNKTPPLLWWHFNHYTRHKWETEAQRHWPSGQLQYRDPFLGP